MKLKKIEINHFKGLKHFAMDLTEYGGKPRFFTGIVGDNGSGKTTVQSLEYKAQLCHILVFLK